MIGQSKQYSSDDIVKALQTKREAEQVLSTLADISDALFKTQNSYTNLLENSNLPYEISSVLNSQLADTTASPLELETLILELRNKIENAPIAQVTVAKPPTKRLYLTISKWCKAHISPSCLIQLSHDYNILGGVIISYKGVVHDYSVRKELNTLKSSGALYNIIQKHVQL